MAAGPVTQVADLIVPAIFTPYTIALTMERSALVQSGILSRSALLDQLLAGGGLTFTVPGFNDLDNDAERVSTDANAFELGGGANPTPNKITTHQQIAVRLNRNNSWSTADLAEALSGTDPAGAIASRVADYWTRRLQVAFIAAQTGVFADNAAVPAGADTHVQNDLTIDVSGASYVAGTTDFTAANFLTAVTTMGDAAGELGTMFVHSVVYLRMQRNNLIDFIPDARGEVNIPTFLGRRVIVDDGMPRTGNVYQTWIFGAGAWALGVGSPKVPTEVQRYPGAGNGGGQEVLYNRVEWCLHPMGHAFAATPANGGPSNAATAGNLADAASWSRRWKERKQIKVARLITREA